jgi:hypothetical protein
MKPKLVIAVVLIALGIVAFAYQGINYTTQGKGVNIGSLHMTTEHEHHIPLPPVLGAIALVGGIVLLVADRRGISNAAAS